MTPHTGDALGAVALYNPHLLSKDELTADFVARQAELNRLVDDLRARIGRAPQHHLVLGQRGMGKSTLLRRLAYAVQDDAALSAAYLPLVLPEEQYNVKHLTDLWLNALDAMSDALEARGVAQASADIDALVATLPSTPTDDAERATRAALLSQASRQGRRLLLLVDNLDLVLDRIRDQDWKLREILQESDALVLVGASSSALESTWQYDRAFYDFFRVHRLTGLTDDETRDVLLALADRRGNAIVRDIALHHPERVRPVRLFAGGNPRTIAVLYEALAAGPDNDLRAVLETLLDRYTPLYKARFEALAVQAQQVLDALCKHWDPATAADLASATGLGVNTVSAQLDRLVTDGVLEKVRSVDKRTGKARKKTAFQVSERFFNIWYLMRASRRARRRLGWLVRFLEAFEGEAGVATLAAALAGRTWSGDADHPSLAAELGVVDGAYATSADEAPESRPLTLPVPARQYALDAPDSTLDGAHPDVCAARAWAHLAAGNQTRALAAMTHVAACDDDTFARWSPALTAQVVGPVAFGLAAAARDLIDAAHLTDRWRPMREALHARALGSPDVLDALAPEVRDPARRLYDSWLGIPPTSPEILHPPQVSG